jgi:hypothetical protein
MIVSQMFMMAFHEKLTFVKRLRELQCVDELRVEARGHLHTHAAKEEPQVHVPKVRLLVPWHLVFLDQASDNGLTGVTCFDDRHGVEGQRVSCRRNCRGRQRQAAEPGSYIP